MLSIEVLLLQLEVSSLPEPTWVIRWRLKNGFFGCGIASLFLESGSCRSSKVIVWLTGGLVNWRCTFHPQLGTHLSKPYTITQTGKLRFKKKASQRNQTREAFESGGDSLKFIRRHPRPVLACC